MNSLCKTFQSFHKLVILILVGIIFSGAVPVVLAEDDKMMRRLFKLHSTLTEKGNVESMVKLGIMYQRGEGVLKNPKKARKLFKQAASLGNKTAISLLNKSSSNKLDTHLMRDTFNKIVPRQKKFKNTVVVPAAKKQWEVDNRIAREKSKAETAKLEQENQRRTQQIELEKQQEIEQQQALEKQNQINNERLKVQEARRLWELERAKALEINREIELATARRQAEEKKKLEALAEQKQKEIDRLLAEKALLQKTEPVKTKTFSSNPCDTPAAKFMSTCL